MDERVADNDRFNNKELILPRLEQQTPLYACGRKYPIAPTIRA